MKPLPILAQAAAGLLDLIYPPKCSVCGALGVAAICHACRGEFREVPRPICGHCGRTLENGGCRDCRFMPAENLTAARSAGVYEGRLRQAIIQLKYGGRRKLAVPLGEFLAGYLRGNPFAETAFDMIIPVPLHPKREFEREFNQAHLIANEVGAALSVPVSSKCLRRIRATRPQVDLHASERAANVEGAFSVVDGAAIQGKKVLLIDDVATTLHTMDSCAEALLAAGARSIYAITVAREL